MCFFFSSYDVCPVCHAHFDVRLDRVPCWNGRLSAHNHPSVRLRLLPAPPLLERLIRVRVSVGVGVDLVPRHGLRCRSGIYDEEPDEVRRVRLCHSCARRVRHVRFYPGGSTRLAGLGLHIARGSGAGCHVQGTDDGHGTQIVRAEGTAGQGAVTVEVNRPSLGNNPPGQQSPGV